MNLATCLSLRALRPLRLVRLAFLSSPEGMNRKERKALQI